jgi:hypothetical protein
VKDPILWSSALAVCVAVGGAYLFRHQLAGPRPHPAAERPEFPAPPIPPGPSQSELPPVRYPVPQPTPVTPESTPGTPAATATEQPRAQPALDSSDAAVETALSGLFPGQSLAERLNLDGVVRRLVVTVDNLTAQKLPRRRLATRPVPERFAVETQGETPYLGRDNWPRYSPLVTLLEAADGARLAQVYVELYPLFQQAYEELGYPDRYFNDRVVEVIDHLLETPDIDDRVELVRVRGVYQFADPRLEALSAGQKALLRSGPDNARRVKSVLQEWRAILVDLPHNAQRRSHPAG